jgi:hypothetical protein
MSNLSRFSADFASFCVTAAMPGALPPCSPNTRCPSFTTMGSIEPGKEATLFAANGDILDIRTQVRRRWIRGVETRLESRHTRLYDKYRSRPLAS